MNYDRERKCPVCGGESQNDSPRCEICGFPYAFIKNFIGGESKSQWHATVQMEKRAQIKNMQNVCEKKKNFTLSENAVSYVSPCDGMQKITTVRGGSCSACAVRLYSASARHEVTLFMDGTLQATGENTYGQCDVGDLRNIVSVTAAPNATYAIDSGGNLKVRGLVSEPSVKNWSSLTSIACGSYHIVGLTKEGRVLIAGDMLDENVKKKVLSWKNAVSVAAAMEATLCLHQNGTVSFAGRETDPRREAENWKNIVSVAADSVYAFGLTSEGKILMAGRSKNELLDMGRRGAADWRDVIAIACSRSGIGALLADGTVRIAGNVRDATALQNHWNIDAASIAADLRKNMHG